MKTLIVGGIMAICFSLLGCSGIDPATYQDMQPKMDLAQYFNGPVKAWGLVQDRSGNVVTRFDIDMNGTWQGDEGVLDEKFRYYSGEQKQRIWKIKRLSADRYEGRADDIIGKATGETYGNAMRWTYEMDVPVGETTYKLKFDDWMWLMNDGVLINRSYMKKWGVTVAEITIFMQKIEQGS